MRIWIPWLLHNPGQTHSFFSMTRPGSWSYGIKADVLQNTARGNRYLHFLILSALQQANMNKGPNKSFASDDSRRQQGRASSDVVHECHFFPLFFLKKWDWAFLVGPCRCTKQHRAIVRAWFALQLMLQSTHLRLTHTKQWKASKSRNILINYCKYNTNIKRHYMQHRWQQYGAPEGT